MSTYNPSLFFPFVKSTDSDIHVGAIGLVVELTFYDKGVVSDISTATVRKMLFRKPSGSVVEKEVPFSTDGKNGKIRYSTVTGDVDEAGLWRVQGYIESPEFTGYTSIVQFEVGANLK